MEEHDLRVRIWWPQSGPGQIGPRPSLKAENKQVIPKTRTNLVQQPRPRDVGDGVVSQVSVLGAHTGDACLCDLPLICAVAK